MNTEIQMEYQLNLTNIFLCLISLIYHFFNLKQQRGNVIISERDSIYLQWTVAKNYYFCIVMNLHSIYPQVFKVQDGYVEKEGVGWRSEVSVLHWIVVILVKILLLKFGVEIAGSIWYHDSPPSSPRSETGSPIYNNVELLKNLGVFSIVLNQINMKYTICFSWLLHMTKYHLHSILFFVLSSLFYYIWYLI